MACRPKRKSTEIEHSPLPCSSIIWDYNESSQSWTGSGTSTNTRWWVWSWYCNWDCGWSGNACNVDISEMEDCFAVDSENTKTSHTRRKQRAADKWEIAVHSYKNCGRETMSFSSWCSLLYLWKRWQLFVALNVDHSVFIVSIVPPNYK